MPDATDRLKHLLDLASRNTPQERARLVAELCELLLAWPEDYPLTMRSHFDRLLEKAAQDVDRATRAEIAQRFAALPDAPVGLLNELFFDAPEAVRPAILRRNALAHEAGAATAQVPPDGERALIAAARARAREDLATQFAHILGVENRLARRILHEPGGEPLAAACKGAHLKRTTFSTLAVLFAPESAEKERRLGAYDAVPQDGAESLVQFWRAHPHLGQGLEESDSEAA